MVGLLRAALQRLPPGLAKRIFENSGVVSRHGAVNPLVEDASGWSTAKRMGRYLTEALPLGKDAVSGALDAAGLRPAEIGLFVVCSCTGYATPGLDILLARDLGMAPTHAAALHRAHGLLRRAARARRRGGLRGRRAAGRRCCSASS